MVLKLREKIFIQIGKQANNLISVRRRFHRLIQAEIYVAHQTKIFSVCFRFKQCIPMHIANRLQRQTIISLK